ncbi:hemolysin family protein [Clostridium vincentii]|uniref:Magnesium and cobalt efflux protein CorC n=1 Tax=Clostridium vincentii TaxID=52704 RepID=A0A2T0BER7_9CLOT|nr:hemolysin family protein [Clostridium vincentii]PRR82358.1 Magnesium and cobalt efflux protein CorC [Clostridium vincentii]
MDEGPVLNAINISNILLLVALTLINAFFASAEMAIVSVNKNRIRMLANEGNKRAESLYKLIGEPTKFLSTVQVGITLAGFFASASAATAFSDPLGQVLINLNIPYGSQIAFVGVTIILSYFTLVFGELFPKRIALANAESISMIVVGPILFISKILTPFIKILSLSTSGLVKISGLQKKELEEKVTKEEIRALVQEGEISGSIKQSEMKMLQGVFEFDDKKAEKIMTPRTDVYCIDIEANLDTYIDELLEKRYTRVPVYEEEIDNIIGILYMKDFLLEAKKKGFDNVILRDILIEPYFVPECKKIQELFKDMKASKSKMAIIIDEYGGFSGIITTEDVVEEIMGEINDEYQSDDEEIIKVTDRTFLVHGSTPLEEIKDKLGIDIESDDIDTISGFLINLIGNIPIETENKIIELNEVTYKVEKVTDKRIETIMITI